MWCRGFSACSCLLPVGLGSGARPDSGAPLNPMLAKKAKIASGAAAILWIGFYAAPCAIGPGSP